jgi:hypothetical protein
MTRDCLAQRFRLGSSPRDQFQINVDAWQFGQAAHLRQAPSRGRVGIKLMDCEAILSRKLIEQLLDVAAASAMLYQQKHAHSCIPSRLVVTAGRT